MKKENKILARQDRRISLRCPLILGETTLEQSRLDGSFSVHVSLEFPEGSTVTDSVKAVVLTVRTLNKEGDPILTADGSEVSAKQIRFGEEGFPVGQKTDFSFPAELLNTDEKIGGLEVGISRVHFADGSVVDYPRGDFFAMPGAPTPIGKIYSKDTQEEILDRFGESANCVPEKLSSIVWRCTCGELCQEEVCPHCQATKAGVFGYFGDTDAILSPKQSIKKWVMIGAIVLCSLILVVLLIACAVFGTRYLKEREANATTTDSASSAITTGLPDPEDPGSGVIDAEDARKMVDYYLENQNFSSALYVAKQWCLGSSVEEMICQQAISYYSALHDYTSAEEYASNISAYDMTSLYTEAFTYYYEKQSYDEAYSYALLLNDSEKIAQIRKVYLEQLLAEKDYEKALELVETELPDQLESVLSEAVDYYCSQNDFEKALTLAEKSADGQLRDLVLTGAVTYYMGILDYDRAISYVLELGNAELAAEVIQNLSADAIRENIPAYFAYLTPEKLREVLGTELAAGRTAAVICNEGSLVAYGAGQIYEVPEGKTAVSVSTGRDHTVILLSDGTVVALGDNSYGQCNTTLWSNIVAIAAGQHHTIGLTSSGTVVSCGSNTYGQTRVSSFRSVVSIAAGDNFTALLLSDGTVTAVGDNSSGQCDTSSWTNIRSLAAGSIHLLGLTGEGTVVGTGCTLTDRLNVSGWKNVVSIAAGQSISVALLSDGTVVSCGGTIGYEEPTVSVLLNPEALAAGQMGVVAITSTGKIVSMGYGAPDVDWINDLLESGLSFRATVFD